MEAEDIKQNEAYIQFQVERIVNEPDSQKAAQLAFNLVADFNDSDVGAMACKALFDRDRAQGKNEAPALAAAVGNDLLRGQLNGQIKDAEAFHANAFARGNLGINGFNQQYHIEASPGYIQNIHQAVGTLVDKHNALSQATEINPDVTADMAQDFLDLCTAQHYSEASMNYLASQKQVILTDQSYNDRLIQGVKSDDTPRQAPKDYVAPEPSEQRLHAAREQLANNWTNNNGPLRVVNPAIAARKQERIPGDPSSIVNLSANINWVAGAQISQQIVSKYGNEALNFAGQELKQQAADKVFTPENKEKVAEMHAKLERENHVPEMNLLNGCEVDKELRAMQIEAMRGQTLEQPAVEAQTKRRTVREMLTAAKESVQKKLGLTTDQKIADQATKQAEKRQARIDGLKDLLVERKAQLEAHPQKDATIRGFDPIGGQNQAEFLDALDLKGEIQKIEKLITKNEDRITALKEKAAKFQAKADFKAGFQQGRQQNQVGNSKLSAR